MKRPLPFLLLLFLLAPALASEMALFEIRHRPAADLVEPLRTLLGERGGVTAQGSRLIVRAPAERLEEVRWLVRELDQPPRRLIVEVRTRAAGGRRRTHLDIDGYGMRAQVNVMEGHTRRNGEGVQRVQTLDGRPALIRIGQSVPIYQVERHREGPYFSEQLRVRYRDLDTGIVVLPRLHGDQVTVEVHQQAERPATGQRFESEQATTVVSGRLGEWLPVGSIETTLSDRQQGIGLHARTRAESELDIAVRVLPAE